MEAPLDGLMTLDELCSRVGLTVRNVRFYTSRGLVPPPIRHGRSGYYSGEHVARIELVLELQAHGFTLSAIERYVSALPADAEPEDIALARTMLAPWQSDLPVDMERSELEQRAGRDLSEEDVATLVALGIVRVRADRFLVARTQLGIGVQLLELGFPRAVAEAARDVYQSHGRQMAEELHQVITEQLAPLYGADESERFQEVMESLKPLSVGGLVTAYETAVARAARTATTK
ncbi:MerR family transcriptional regulator [Nocardioides dongxiaopingii]|uniref:MerR family transcriptional regulator n=1 Tax=Nocardioides dongxiaopingii TaxID=2576036 RepID=UPI001FE9CF62|nr:MerR family transcriptional regulator [Nocardioides dongxiaopingii]